MVATAAGIMPLKGSISRDLLLEPVDVEARGVLKHAFAGSTPTLRAIAAHYLRKLL